MPTTTYVESVTTEHRDCRHYVLENLLPHFAIILFALSSKCFSRVYGTVEKMGNVQYHKMLYWIATEDTECGY